MAGDRGSLPSIGAVSPDTRRALLELDRRGRDNDPIGVAKMWLAATAPAGHQLLDGTAISRSANPILFGLWGTTYGAGDGSTTFNVPNLKGRVPVGRDSGQTEFDQMGETGGAKTHTLSTAELPSHTHANTLTNAIVAAASHAHALSSSGWAAIMAAVSAAPNFFMRRIASSSWTANIQGQFGANPAASATSQSFGAELGGNTNANATTTTVGISNTAEGGGGAHNNLQPYIVVNWIVRLG